MKRRYSTKPLSLTNVNGRENGYSLFLFSFILLSCECRIYGIVITQGKVCRVYSNYYWVVYWVGIRSPTLYVFHWVVNETSFYE